MWPLALALGGVDVRVHPDYVSDARQLLADVAERPPAIRPRIAGSAVLDTLIGILLMMCAAGPPTRTPSTFLLRNEA